MKYCGGTFSGYKSVLCAPEIMVLSHHCTHEGCLPDQSHVAVIVNWSDCEDLSNVCSFLGTISICRIFIRNFAHNVHPLVKLTQKQHPFEWGPDQKAAQDLKTTLVTPPALQLLDYTSRVPIILSVDTLYIAIGHILSQCNPNNPKICYYTCFGSITFNECKARFSQPKFKLYGLYQAVCAL